MRIILFLLSYFVALIEQDVRPAADVPVACTELPSSLVTLNISVSGLDNVRVLPERT